MYMLNRDAEGPFASLASPGLQAFFRAVAPATHAVLRIAAALLFMQHGVQKFFGLLGGFGAPGATAPLVSQMGLAGVLETFGGLLILLGLLTRPVALILVGEMLAAYFIAHYPQGGFPIQNGGELALIYAAVFAFLFGNGAGPLSLDAWIAGRRRDSRFDVIDEESADAVRGPRPNVRRPVPERRDPAEDLEVSVGARDARDAHDGARR
jgi:putative oxidoreductase